MTLTKCNSHKTPGEDQLNMELFKYATSEFKTCLLAFFNRILNGEKHPESWNKAIVIPIYKKGDENNLENYRALAY
jgi:hypothetical protein